MSDRVDHDFAY
ncbi:hypothetical protein Ahy_A07g031544 isoform C [Arachis hypogaea]|uniref:Uncharacterized protein n=1 Tax=Arachis hypogaea TaxID=3818 RepID=A0A445C4A0_ARAHY|nr:hypothetical protein Ahy_A07g031544 isoform C [Arachis hypogaea]